MFHPSFLHTVCTAKLLRATHFLYEKVNFMFDERIDLAVPQHPGLCDQQPNNQVGTKMREMLARQKTIAKGIHLPIVLGSVEIQDSQIS